MADPCPYGQKDCPGGAQCVCALPRVNGLRKLHAEITASDGHECEMMALVRWAADEIERLGDLRVRLREAIELVKLHATTEHWTWIREVESELSDDTGALNASTPVHRDRPAEAGELAPVRPALASRGEASGDTVADVGSGAVKLGYCNGVSSDGMPCFVREHCMHHTHPSVMARTIFAPFRWWLADHNRWAMDCSEYVEDKLKRPAADAPAECAGCKSGFVLKDGMHGDPYGGSDFRCNTSDVGAPK